jgi:hypothetical protein
MVVGEIESQVGAEAVADEVEVAPKKMMEEGFNGAAPGSIAGVFAAEAGEGGIKGVALGDPKSAAGPWALQEKDPGAAACEGEI